MSVAYFLGKEENCFKMSSAEIFTGGNETLPIFMDNEYAFRVCSLVKIVLASLLKRRLH